MTQLHTCQPALQGAANSGPPQVLDKLLPQLLIELAMLIYSGKVFALCRSPLFFFFLFNCVVGIDLVLLNRF